MSRRVNLAERASLSLIAHDTELFRDLTLAPRLEPIRGIAILALMPFLSAWAYESSGYIGRKDAPPRLALKPQEEMLLTSRMRAKITEDKYKTPAEVLENANDLAEINSGWFVGGHRGILGILKRALQPEVGVYFVGDEVVCTTHTAFSNMGLTKEAISEASLSLDNLGPHMRDRMVDVGKYMAMLFDKLGISPHPSEGDPEIPLPRIRDRDLKADRLYGPIVRRVAPGRSSVGVLLTWMLSQVNTARLLVPSIAGQNEVADFKVRFVSLYQSALSLRRLLEEEREQAVLFPDALETIAAVLDADPVQRVLAYRNLRNDLFHYGVPKRMAPDLSPGLPLFGLVEAHTNGRSLAAVTEDVEAGLDRVSMELRGLTDRITTPGGHPEIGSGCSPRNPLPDTAANSSPATGGLILQGPLLA